MRDLPRPKCQPNQTHCTAGDALLTLLLDCGLGPKLVTRTVKKIDSLDWRFWSKEHSSCRSNVNKTVHVKQCNTAAMTWTFYTTFTQLLLAYTGLHYTWGDNIIQKPLKAYSGGIRTSQEASEFTMKHQEGVGNTRPGRETSLSSEGRLFRESKLGRETSLSFEGRLYRKSRRDRDSKLNRDITLGWEVAPPGRVCWAGRAGWAVRLASGGRAGCAGRAG